MKTLEEIREDHARAFAELEAQWFARIPERWVPSSYAASCLAALARCLPTYAALIAAERAGAREEQD